MESRLCSRWQKSDLKTMHRTCFPPFTVSVVTTTFPSHDSHSTERTYVLTLNWKFDGCLSPFGSEGVSPQLGTDHWHASTYPLGQPRGTSDTTRGKITVRSNLGEVLGCTNWLGAGSIRQEHFAQPFVPALYGRRRNKTRHVTSQPSGREMESQRLGNKYTVSRQSVV